MSKSMYKNGKKINKKSHSENRTAPINPITMKTIFETIRISYVCVVMFIPVLLIQR